MFALQTKRPAGDASRIGRLDMPDMSNQDGASKVAQGEARDDGLVGRTVLSRIDRGMVQDGRTSTKGEARDDDGYGSPGSMGTAQGHSDTSGGADKDGHRTLSSGNLGTTNAGGVPRDAAEAISDGDAAFLAGYRAYGGRPEWEQHFLRDVLPCEGGPAWGIADYGNGYLGRAQFTGDSWTRAGILAAKPEPLDAASPIDVGVAVAVWSNAIDHPGSSGGWPWCWWQGDVP